MNSTQHDFQILCQKKDDNKLKNAACEGSNNIYETIFSVGLIGITAGVNRKNDFSITMKLLKIKRKTYLPAELATCPVRRRERLAEKNVLICGLLRFLRAYLFRGLIPFAGP